MFYILILLAFRVHLKIRFLQLAMIQKFVGWHSEHFSPYLSQSLSRML